jgi:hypothetical protein
MPIAASSLVPEALWALLPLCVLLVAALVLLFRRILRDRANAALSRDRAHVDLQMMVHTLQSKGIAVAVTLAATTLAAAAAGATTAAARGADDDHNQHPLTLTLTLTL